MDFLLAIGLVSRFSAITGGWQKIREVEIFVCHFCMETPKNPNYRCIDHLAEHSILQFRFSAGYVQIFKSYIPHSWLAENARSQNYCQILYVLYGSCVLYTKYRYTKYKIIKFRISASHVQVSSLISTIVCKQKINT